MQDELKQTHPIQRAYVEAKRHVLIDPELALAKFSALIDVYDDDTTESDVTRHYVKLARQQRDRVQKQIDSYAPEGRKLVESRIARAAEVAAENPALATNLSRRHRAVRRKALGGRPGRKSPRGDQQFRRADGKRPVSGVDLRATADL